MGMQYLSRFKTITREMHLNRFCRIVNARSVQDRAW